MGDSDVLEKLSVVGLLEEIFNHQETYPVVIASQSLSHLQEQQLDILRV